MRVASRTLAAAKAGNAPEEYEDAAWPRRAVRHDLRSFRVAAADGATETSFSGLWARLLVRAYGMGRLRPDRLTADLAPLRAAWRAEVGVRPLSWYAEEKVRHGAYAALLGLSVRTDGTWSAVAVGDTCLFHVRSGTLLLAFPITHSEGFSNRPVLIGTDPAGDGPMHKSLLETGGTCVPGDTWYLATDALAAWMVRVALSGGAPWPELDRLCLRPRSRFEAWLAARRADGTMRNDDVTLVRVAVE